MLIGITTGGKIGLGVAALAFIGFALLSSFYLPRRNPDFPGERLRGFVWFTVLLFVALIAAVVVFAKESEEEHGGEGATVTHAETETTATTETTETTETETTGGSEGDAAAGEAVFSSAGCGACHTLEAAGASGGVGPNLDDARPAHDLVVDRVTNGRGVMPSFSGDLSEAQIQDVAAYVVASTQG